MSTLRESIEGWTVNTVRRSPLGNIGFADGPLAGLSNAAPALAAAQPGEVWCVYTSYAGDLRVFAFGGITEAHRTCPPIAAQAARGIAFPASDHCPCD